MVFYVQIFLFFINVTSNNYNTLQEASFEFLQNEAERTLLEAMDSLEVAFSHPTVSIDPVIFPSNFIRTTVFFKVLL